MGGIGRAVGEVAIEALLWPLSSRDIDLTRIKSLALLPVFEQIVRSGDILEPCLRLLVAWMQIWLKFGRQLLERGLDFLVGCK